ncbi:MAG: DUF928 domain-containing protein [Gammaproteobacteria bacterium]|nr:DUF928 domain-containing protein [Gammaproteobacteria bacterium]
MKPYALIAVAGCAMLNSVYADCPKAADMPCYQVPAELSQTHKRRHTAGSIKIRGPIMRTWRKRGGGLIRGVSHRFAKSLNMPCGKSAAFPEKFRCAGQRKTSPPAGISPILVFPKGKRGEVEVIERRTLPDMAPLAPEHPGLSLSNQPTLYWFLSKVWPGSLEFTLTSSGAPEPELITTLEKPGGFFAAGIHGLSLAEYNVSLKAGVEYEWFVSIIGDPEQRAGDFIAGGVIQYHTQIAGASAGPAQTPDVRELARQGAWYDAVDAASRQAADNPQDPKPRKQRAALLKQVNLPEVAAYDESRLWLNTK